MASKYSVTIEELRENTSHGIILGGIRPNSVILECGSSSGYMTRYMKEKLNASVSIVERDESDFNEAMTFADDGILSDLEGREWSEYFGDKRFDYILFADVLEHLRSPQEVLNRAVSLLKEDGVIITSIPNVGHHDILIRLLHNRWDYMPLGLLDNTHIHFWAEQNLSQFFTEAGLAVIRRDYAILPAFGTEQRSLDEIETVLPAIHTICQRRYGDVYQFVFFSQRAEYVQKNGIAPVDLYQERHERFSAQPQCCLDYQEMLDQKELKVQEQHTWIEHQDSVIREQEAHIENQDVSLKKQADWIEHQDQVIQTQKDRIEEQDAHIEEQKTRLEDKKQQVETITQRYAQLQTLYNQLDEENRRLRFQYDDISNAFFWKITKPFRAVLDALKRVFRSNEPMRRLWVRIKGVDESQPVDQEAASSASAAAFYSVGDPMTVLCTKHTLFVARLVANSLEKLGITAHILTEEPEVYSEEVHIVICPQMFQRMPGRYIAFQMEQTVSSRWLTDEYYDRLNHAYAVFDYSLVNVAHFKRMTSFGKAFYYLPIDYLPSLKRTDEGYEYDLLFYGDANNPRRQRILAELQKRFSVKVVSEVFGEELYRLLAQARAVVNIHYYDNAMLETTRLYEVLSLGRSMVISERSSDPEEEKRLEGIVDFVPVDDTKALIDRVEYWLSHETERAAAVEKNNQILTQRSNAFDYFFYRFLLAQDWISFDRFYELSGDFVTFTGNRICLSLPEATDRREAFDRDNKYGFEVIPGLRHFRGWTGCGLSYKFIMKRAKDQGLREVLVCEDDVLFPDDFENRWEKCLKYLEKQEKWDIFQGLMADVGRVTVSRVDHGYGQTFVYLNHMISMVFNLYKSSVYDSLIGWDETDPDVQRNTIDRALEAKDLNIVAMAPFLVGHKEDLDSVIWGFNNSQYRELIDKSSEKLMALAQEFEGRKKEHGENQ